MANNPFMRDNTILSESVYLNYLKGDKKKVNEFVEPVTGMALAALVALVTKAAVESYKKDYTLQGRKCQVASKGDQAAYSQCMHRAKVSAEMKKLTVYKTARSKCDKTREPEKCVIKMENMIKKQQHVIAKLKEKK